MITDMKLGMYEKAVPRGLPLEEKLRLAKEMGYDYLELSTDESEAFRARMKMTPEEIAELRNTITKLQFPIYTMCLSGNRIIPIGSEDPETRERGMELIYDAVRFANAIGIRIIQVMAYDEYYKEQNETTVKLFMENLRKAVEYAGSYGVMLALENVDIPLMDELDKGVKIVEEINSPWLNLYPDLGNIYANGFSNEEGNAQYRRAARYIVASHVKDTIPGQCRDINYGDGGIDFKMFFKTLIDIGFSGPLTLEMWDQGDGKCYEDAARAVTFVKEKMKEAMS